MCEYNFYKYLPDIEKGNYCAYKIYVDDYSIQHSPDSSSQCSVHSSGREAPHTLHGTHGDTVEADVQLTFTCWHISTNEYLLANTHLLTATLKGLLLPLRFKRNAWIPSHWVRRTKAEAEGVVTYRLPCIWTGDGF